MGLLPAGVRRLGATARSSKRVGELAEGPAFGPWRGQGLLWWQGAASRSRQGAWRPAAALRPRGLRGAAVALEYAAGPRRGHPSAFAWRGGPAGGASAPAPGALPRARQRLVWPGLWNGGLGFPPPRGRSSRFWTRAGALCRWARNRPSCCGCGAATGGGPRQTISFKFCRHGQPLRMGSLAMCRGAPWGCRAKKRPCGRNWRPCMPACLGRRLPRLGVLARRRRPLLRRPRRPGRRRLRRRWKRAKVSRHWGLPQRGRPRPSCHRRRPTSPTRRSAGGF